MSQPWAPVFIEVADPTVVVETGYSLTDRNETLIQSGDWVGIAQSKVEINRGDFLETDGKRLRVVEVRPLNPGGTVLLYELVARA